MRNDPPDVRYVFIVGGGADIGADWKGDKFYDFDKLLCATSAWAYTLLST
jgi:hypothetical protein